MRRDESRRSFIPIGNCTPPPVGGAPLGLDLKHILLLIHRNKVKTTNSLINYNNSTHWWYVSYTTCSFDIASTPCDRKVASLIFAKYTHSSSPPWGNVTMGNVRTPPPPRLLQLIPIVPCRKVEQVLPKILALFHCHICIIKLASSYNLFFPPSKGKPQWHTAGGGALAIHLPPNEERRATRGQKS